MKEIIVIKDTEQTFNIVAQFPTQVKPKDFEHTIEQVPETFEELKELCKKSVVTIDIGNGKAEGKEVEYIDVGLFILCSNNKIYLEDLRKGIIVVAQDQAPKQMWEKIKGWIGEE